MKCLVIGSINKDIVFKVDHIVKDGETISSFKETHFLGGKGLNQAISISQMFPDTYFYCNINKNDTSLIEDLNKYPFKKDYITLTNSLTGTAFIQVDNSGENAIVISKNANDEIELDKVINILNDFEESDVVVLQNEINDIDKIIALCQKRGLTIVLNPSPITNKMTLSLMSHVDYLVVNKDEFLSITSSSSIEKGLHLFRQTNQMTKIVITLGKKGVIYQDPSKEITVKGIKVNAVDTTCAGDTFLGFFIGSILNNQTIETSLQVATKAASICVQKEGASVSIPTYKDVYKNTN